MPGLKLETEGEQDNISLTFQPGAGKFNDVSEFVFIESAEGR